MPGHMPSRSTVVACLVALLALLLLAGLFPEADPVDELPGFKPWFTEELVVEAPAKAHEARNWALFGEWHRNPADNYQFWRVQAPAWVYPLAWVFDAFGVSYTTLRWFSVAFSAFGFVAFAVLAARALPGLAAALACWLLATNLFVTQMARSGLVELPINAWLAWMVVCLWLARAHPGWLVASQVTFAIAFFTKSGAVYAFPLLVAANVWTFWQMREDFPRLRWLPVLTAAAIAVFTTVYVLQPEYQRTLAWNVGHLLTGIQHEAPSPTPQLDANRIFEAGVLMFPVIGALGVPGTILLGWHVWRTRGRDRWEVLILGWVLCAWAVVMLSRIWTLRHSSILFLPGYLVVGWTFARIWAIAHLEAVRPTGLRVLVGATVAFTLVTHAAHQARAFSDLSWQLKRAEQAVISEIGDKPAVFAGRFVSPLLLGTPYDVFYVKPGFNTEPEAVRALGFTHGLVHYNDVVLRYLERADSRYERPEVRRKLRFRGLVFELVRYPAEQEEPVRPTPRASGGGTAGKPG